MEDNEWLNDENDELYNIIYDSFYDHCYQRPKNKTDLKPESIININNPRIKPFLSFKLKSDTTNYRSDNIQIYQHTKKIAYELIDNDQDLPTSLKIKSISELIGVEDLIYNQIDPKTFTDSIAEELLISYFSISSYQEFISTDIQLIHGDCLNVAYNLLQQGHTPLVLNMANPDCPGGGVENGANAQEESIFRRSNYFMTLYQDYYPITRTETVLSKHVQVFKDKDYKMIYPFYLNFIAIPAVRNPLTCNIDTKIDITSDFDYAKEEDRNTMRYKIFLIFLTAMKYQYHSLVLSAFGCGAFHNPPSTVAKLYYEAIALFQSYFTHIHISIIDNKSSHNYDLFKKILTE